MNKACNVPDLLLVILYSGVLSFCPVNTPGSTSVIIGGVRSITNVGICNITGLLLSPPVSISVIVSLSYVSSANVSKVNVISPLLIVDWIV